ncbi:branched-chain amino acid transport system II carrier protein, partial [uncultured Enorma sp.]|uniref:branched-chain amino acid transport system II carrier protein n=1 Tax=uncultured Enorma sp. TaxID=1714346 RepID=UPI002803B6F6
MFFGAGNLILPPLLGVQAGSAALPALAGFVLTGVGLPVLGIVAVALAGTVRELADRVHPLFSRVFV